VVSESGILSSSLLASERAFGTSGLIHESIKGDDVVTGLPDRLQDNLALAGNLWSRFGHDCEEHDMFVQILVVFDL